MTEDLGFARPARVLIVDDERANRDLLEVMLAAEGLQLTTAASGPAAMVEVAKCAPDLILLDLMMPTMDGYELATKFKNDAATKHIPIIIVTALDDRHSRMLALRSGAEELITKPFDRAELCLRVRNLLRLKATGRANDLPERELATGSVDLVESEARFRQIVESLDAVVFLTNLEATEVLYVSPAYDVIFGRSREQLSALPRSWQQSIHPDDRQRVLSKMMPNGTLIAGEVEHRIIRPDGGERSVRVRTYRARDEARDLPRFAILVEDITERPSGTAR